MAKLNKPFNSGDVEPNKAFELIPNGWYAMLISESEIKPVNDKPQCWYVKLRHEVAEGYHPEHANRVVFSNLNLGNDNPDAVQIAERDFSAICRAVGKPIVEDTDEVHGILMSVKIGTKAARAGYDAQNVVKGYAPLSEHFKPTTAPVAATAADKPAAAPASGAAGEPAPWERGDKPSTPTGG